MSTAVNNDYTERTIEHLASSIRNIRTDALQDAINIVEEQMREMEKSNKTERVNALRVVLYRIIALRNKTNEANHYSH